MCVAGISAAARNPYDAYSAPAKGAQKERRAYGALLQNMLTGIMSVSHEFRRKRGMDGARNSKAKAKMLYRNLRITVAKRV